MKVYISGALQASSDLTKARALYERAAQILSLCGHDVYVPHKNTDPEHAHEVSSASVFARDSEQMLNADSIVAFLNEPSLGVGAELAMAVGRHIPIFAFVEKGRPVSRFLRGMLTEAQVAIAEYESLSDLDSRLLKMGQKAATRAA